MKLTATPIHGVFSIDTSRFVDHRGAFARFYCEHELTSIIGERRILQINHSRTVQIGAIRGLHCQKTPNAEMKLVRCLKGRVWDVAVDLRADSPTFLQWHAEELSPDNARMLVIPEGCAHGFQVLEADSELLYLHTAMYAPDSELGFAYNDPALTITWPLIATDLSQRDQSHLPITSTFSGLQL